MQTELTGKVVLVTGAAKRVGRGIALRLAAEGARVLIHYGESEELVRKSGGGRIVNISSLGGIRPWAEHAHYCASKAGVIMLTRALAKAFAPEITVNSVAPGVIPFGPTDTRVDAMIQDTPAKRAGTADEIAGAVVYFLAATNFITGQLL